MSQVDMYWSIVPAVYCWICYLAGPGPKGLLIACLVTLWSIRLTYNFARKGGYSGVEDYRWAVVRTWFSSQILLTLFNLVVISIAQNIIILGFALPAYVLAQYPNQSISGLDCVLAVLMLLFIVGETVADQQQWRFQQAKKQGKSGIKGFIDTGLFRYSRHPNVFCELCIWWTFHGFALVATGQYLHWTVIGPLVLTALISSSTDLTESISLSKYPDYRLYQQSTSRIIPGLPRPKLA
jgi:steroid 5-alpha reductase family enzyme